MNRAMPIPNVTALIVKCWTSAEEQAREGLKKRFHDKNEEFITELFHGEFRGALDAATKAGSVKQAFCKDVKLHIPELGYSGDLERLASGISATVTLHPREVEERTGGDIDLVLIRPNVNFHPFRKGTLTVDQHYSRGLLCQAKIKRRSPAGHKAKWGDFTQSQRKILRNRTQYLALLLYEYHNAERSTLMPFQWQVCGGANFKDVECWLKSGVFPSLLTSEKIIHRLADDKIGTGQKDIIEQLIAPAVRGSLVIRVGWPPGQGPSQNFFLRQGTFQNQSQTQHRLLRC